MAHYGYTGKILRVNLTNGAVSTLDTEPYKPYVGGMGLGYKVIWDEVPLDTDPLSPAAKVVVATGPLTGTGTPCSGRTNASFLTPYTEGYSICDAHIGGHWAQYMKHAGYDAVIIEGRSARPVYLKIDNDTVTLEPAGHLWGEGTFYTNQQVAVECGPEFTSFAIGPAGENLVYYSIIHGSQGHSGGGGVGAVFGSKNLKAIACRGTGSIKLANPEEVLRLADYMNRELIGGNNNHNVPRTPQSWAEFSHHAGAGRWSGAPNRYWGANPSGPVSMGEQPYWDNNRIAYRSFKNEHHHTQGFGANAEPYMVKEGGCSHCPVRCYGQYEVEKLEEHGIQGKFTNTCVAIRFGSHAWYPGFNDLEDEGVSFVPGTEPRENRFMAAHIAAKTADDLGIWCNYGMLWGEFIYALSNGYLNSESNGGRIPDAEHAQIQWDLMENFDPQWLTHVLGLIAANNTEFALLGAGPYTVAARWDYPDSFWDGGVPGRETTPYPTRQGYPVHHSTEAFQASLLHNFLFNRDNMAHTIANWNFCGLPHDVLRPIVESYWGPGCWDPPAAEGRTPINQSKVNLAKWAFIRKNWHDMATLCDWIWPMVVSPSRERGYYGDLDLDAKFMAAVTGENWDTDRVHECAERVSAMLRVITAISYNIHHGHTNLRETHDKLTEHWFTRQPDLEPFAPGATKYCRDDWALALDMFYTTMGYDVETGIPTRATLNRLGLQDMAAALEERNMLPG
jgi:aldehyde:ferredoxin oxidoreductase